MAVIKLNIKEFLAAKPNAKGISASNAELEATIADVSLPRAVKLQEAQEVTFPDGTKKTVTEKQVIDVIIVDGSCTDRLRFCDWEAMLPILWGAAPSRSYKPGDIIKLSNAYRNPAKEQDQAEIRISRGGKTKAGQAMPGGTVMIIGHQAPPATQASVPAGGGVPNALDKAIATSLANNPAPAATTLTTSKWVKPAAPATTGGEMLDGLYKIFDSHSEALLTVSPDTDLPVLQKIEAMAVKNDLPMLVQLYGVFDRHSKDIMAMNNVLGDKDFAFLDAVETHLRKAGVIK